LYNQQASSSTTDADMEGDNDDKDATTSRPSKTVKTDSMYDDDDFELTKETYVFPKCPAIDIVSAVRVTSSDRQVSYHPLLMSVKCKNMRIAKILASIDKIKKFLEVVQKKELNQLNALCLLVVIGKTPLNKFPL
jgi:hypothetical protein